MDTQKLNITQAPKKKGVEPSTVAKAGAGVAAAGIAATAVVAGLNQMEQDEPVATGEELAQQTNPNEQNEQEPQEQQAQPQPQPQAENLNEPTPIAPDQPGTSGSSTGGSVATVEVETDPVDPAEAEALAIAQHLVESDEIDFNDIDAPSMAFVATDVIYDEDGAEIPVALVNMPDSDEPFLLADIDGDRVYDYMVDTNGNIVGAMGTELNIDDAEFALADDGTYLAADEDSIQLIENEDVAEDIVVLGDGDLLADAGSTHDLDGYVEPENVLDDSEPIDDIIGDIGYDAPDEG